ncbi:hypothetical protein Nepgr_002383 [Nepenthes gracilis]|uniref:Methyltransferase n=1 Tax=Nepenthes gracilis TaxID=150966 RepID=A0AAD3RXR8_NEPGR|nr:hypothetical protein Nepgr_002383 [Nepenthes gracilis]
MARFSSIAVTIFGWKHHKWLCKLTLLDRILCLGGYWIMSEPPIIWQTHLMSWGRTGEELNSEQSAIEAVAKSLCWKKLKQKGDFGIWPKPTNHIHCKKNRKIFKKLSLCKA